MKAYTFSYAVGEPVRVAPLGVDGFVDSVSMDNRGDMYRVVYWTGNGDRKVEWVYPSELCQPSAVNWFGFNPTMEDNR